MTHNEHGDRTTPHIMNKDGNGNCVHPDFHVFVSDGHKQPGDNTKCVCGMFTRKDWRKWSKKNKPAPLV